MRRAAGYCAELVSAACRAIARSACRDRLVTPRAAHGPPLGGRQQALALRQLARRLAGPPYRLALFARPALGGLLVEFLALQLAKESLALQLLFEDAQGLVDVVVAYENLQE